MPVIPEIKLLKGFCQVSFGETMERIRKEFGEPEEIQHIQDDILKTSTTVFHYWEEGFSLFFDDHRNQVFCSAEIDNRETILLGTRIFTLKEKELIEFMKKQGFALSDTEVHEWGEKRLSFDEASLDCYFSNNKMVSVNFTIADHTEGPYFFPN